MTLYPKQKPRKKLFFPFYTNNIPRSFNNLLQFKYLSNRSINFSFQSPLLPSKWIFVHPHPLKVHNITSKYKKKLNLLLTSNISTFRNGNSQLFSSLEKKVEGKPCNIANIWLLLYIIRQTHLEWSKWGVNLMNSSGMLTRIFH